MKPYGLERYAGYENGGMDLADCLGRGAKSRYMKMTSKYRQEIRQIHKGRERTKVRNEIDNYIFKEV